MKIKGTFLALLLSGSTILASDGMFVGVSAGYNNLSVGQTDKSGSVAIKDMKSNGSNLTCQLGYSINENIETTLNYQRVMQEDVSLNNFYIGAKYKIRVEEFTPYIGVTVGSSTLEWSNNPVKTTNSDINSDSYMAGATLGTLYPLADKVSLTLEYQLQYMNDHITNIELSTGKSELSHKLSHNLNVGVRYSF